MYAHNAPPPRQSPRRHDTDHRPPTTDRRAFVTAIALSIATQAVYLALCGRRFGMPPADALAASLGLWLAHLIVGAAGGAAQPARRRPVS